MKEHKEGIDSGILVYLECYKGRIHPVGMELLGEANRLAKESKQQVFAAAIGTELCSIQKELETMNVNTVYLYEAEDEYHPIFYEQIMVSCIKKIRPSIVLLGGTYEGRSLAPRLAVAFQTGLTADCTELSIDAEGNLIQTRPAFGGNVMASIITKQTRPQLATVRPGIMKSADKQKKSETTFVTEQKDNTYSCMRVCKVESLEKESGIVEQKVLVVAGRGVRKKEDLTMLRELAELLGGRLASTRALVEKGWMTPAEQIGLSGQSVRPDYILTIGVSGTVQFMAGMKHSKRIIAINEDKNARIFQIAHNPICGDLYQIVPLLIEKIKREKGAGKLETAI